MEWNGMVVSLKKKCLFFYTSISRNDMATQILLDNVSESPQYAPAVIKESVLTKQQKQDAYDIVSSNGMVAPLMSMVVRVKRVEHSSILVYDTHPLNNQKCEAMRQFISHLFRLKMTLVQKISGPKRLSSQVCESPVVVDKDNDSLIRFTFTETPNKNIQADDLVCLLFQLMFHALSPGSKVYRCSLIVRQAVTVEEPEWWTKSKSGEYDDEGAIFDMSMDTNKNEEETIDCGYILF